MPKQDHLSLHPRLVSREVAAQFVCCSPNFFDALIAKGLMPPARRLGERKKVWDIEELNRAADALPTAVKPQLARGG
jgi:predicted DNA-binding transcriptional regulator AlpA